MAEIDSRGKPLFRPLKSCEKAALLHESEANQKSSPEKKKKKRRRRNERKDEAKRKPGRCTGAHLGQQLLARALVQESEKD